MIDLLPVIGRIRSLLQEGSEASVTYAALEARLALERVCYDRLRQCHDYIAHDDLKKWQPHQVVNTLIAEVDQHASDTRSLSISRRPPQEGVHHSQEEYVLIGTEVGFDAKLIGKLWNALSKLALHVRLPVSREDTLPEYGDREAVIAKVAETVEELERLSKTTMTFSGIGYEVSLMCTCGRRIRRRAALLQDQQVISCVDPECVETWKAHQTGPDHNFEFERQTANFACQRCHTACAVPAKLILRLKTDEQANLDCPQCDHRHTIQWRLMAVSQSTLSAEGTT